MKKDQTHIKSPLTEWLIGMSNAPTPDNAMSSVQLTFKKKINKKKTSDWRL